MLLSQYLIALGSNQRHARYGHPVRVLGEAKSHLDQNGLSLVSFSTIITSRPVGPSQRNYANAAALIESDLKPPLLLTHLQQLERQFGERRGQRWAARVLDLDIIIWSEGCFAGDRPPLAIPHPAMRERDFVLRPAAEIAPDWRDPLSGLTIRHILHRLKRAKPLDPKQKHY